MLKKHAHKADIQEIGLRLYPAIEPTRWQKLYISLPEQEFIFVNNELYECCT